MLTTAGTKALTGILAGSGASFLYLAYGSGTTAESAAHTALVTETARVLATYQFSTTYTRNDTISLYVQTSNATAGTINEIGVFTASSGGTMLARKKLTTGEAYSAHAPIYLLFKIVAKDGGFGVAA